MTPMRALTLIRIALGSLFLLRTTLGARLAGLSAPTWLYGWPNGGWHPSVFGIALPTAVVCALCVARTLGAIAFVMGRAVRVSGLVAGVCGLLVLTQDPLAFFNTMYLLHVGVVMVALCSPDSLSPLRWLVMSVYAWSGIAKLNADWLSGRVLSDLVTDTTIRLGSSLIGPTTVVFAAVFVVATELSLPIFLFVRRTRSVALVAAVGFHVILEAIMRPDLFGWAMLSLLVAFAQVDKAGILRR